MANKGSQDLLRQEDWLAVWIGFIIIAIGGLAVLTGWFDFSALKFSTWSWGEQEATKAVALSAQIGQWVFWRKLIVTVLVLGVLFTIGIKLQGEKASKYIPAFLALFVVADIVIRNSRFDVWCGKQKTVIRWCIYTFLLFAIIALSSVEQIPFIYFQF